MRKIGYMDDIDKTINIAPQSIDLFLCKNPKHESNAPPNVSHLYIKFPLISSSALRLPHHSFLLYVTLPSFPLLLSLHLSLFSILIPHSIAHPAFLYTEWFNIRSRVFDRVRWSFSRKDHRQVETVKQPIRNGRRRRIFLILLIWIRGKCRVSQCFPEEKELYR